MVTCKELILKEGDGERRTFYDLQVTGWVFLFFFAFLGCSLSCLNIFTFCHFPSDMRLSSKGLHQGAGGGGFGPPDSCRQALDRQTDLRVALGLLASPRPGGESDEKGRQAGGLGP